MITVSDKSVSLIAQMEVQELIEILSRKKDTDTLLAPDKNLRHIILYQLVRKGLDRQTINTLIEGTQNGRTC